MIGGRKISSKILLFGEYSVIKNSMALATPYRIFEGHLKFRPHQESNKHGIDAELKAFCSYLKGLDHKKELLAPLDLDTLEFDISQGLIFDSSIPQGFGVGSSGALCASIFQGYAREAALKGMREREGLDYLQLRDMLGQMEAHFHGASSGIDPLICYLDRPLLIKGKNDIQLVTLPDYSQGKGGLFLLNTHRPRRTEPLVHLFLEKCKDPAFLKDCLTPLINHTNLCIQHFLEGNVVNLSENFKSLSLLQYEYFRPMIPNLLHPLWQQGLEHNHFFLKLCGAGGGGFLLGMTQDFKIAREALGTHEFRPLYYF